MCFPTKNDHFGVFWGYRNSRKHPYFTNLDFSPKRVFPFFRDPGIRREKHQTTPLRKDHLTWKPIVVPMVWKQWKKHPHGAIHDHENGWKWYIVYLNSVLIFMVNHTKLGGFNKTPWILYYKQFQGLLSSQIPNPPTTRVSMGFHHQPLETWWLVSLPWSVSTGRWFFSQPASRDSPCSCTVWISWQRRFLWSRQMVTVEKLDTKKYTPKQNLTCPLKKKQILKRSI